MADYQRGYNPNRSPDWNYGGAKWKLSRSKIDLFLECPRCFYLDNKLGTKRPSLPAFTLNVAVDTLLKREFDEYRKKQAPHPIMTDNVIDALPYAHPELETWRDNFTGITHKHLETGLVVSGAVDDIWVNQAEELIVVDYKATAKESAIKSLSDTSWGEQYQRQVSVYQWLLRQNGFKVCKTAYFVYANGDLSQAKFTNTLSFNTNLIATEGDDSWLEATLAEIKATLESEDLPACGLACEYCPYRTAAGKKLQAVHFKTKSA